MCTMEVEEIFWSLQTCQYLGTENENEENDSSYKTFDNLIIYIPSLPLPKESHESDPKTPPLTSSISLPIYELNENGIMNPIGGELWEASLLLCCLILRNVSYFIPSVVLKLGSGIGIPSILILIIKQRYLRSKSHGSCGSLYLTDCDEEVLHNLKLIVTSQFPESSVTTRADSDLSSSSLVAHVQQIDWNNFLGEDSFVSGQNEMTIPLCDIMIGSELVYTNTQLGLSSLILYVIFYLLRLTFGRHSLRDNRCKEVVIIQLRSRPGFAEFIDSLSAEEMMCSSIEDIPLWMYQGAQQMKEIIKPSGLHSSGEEEGQWNENRWEKFISISSEVIAACQSCPFEDDGTRISPPTFNLRIPREEYCIVRVWKSGMSPLIVIDR